jgi:hypothetical protein
MDSPATRRESAPLDCRSSPLFHSLPILHLLVPMASLLSGIDIAHSIPCISIASLILSLAFDGDGSGGDASNQDRDSDLIPDRQHHLERRTNTGMCLSRALGLVRFHLGCLVVAIGTALLTGLGALSMYAAMLTE